MSLQLKEGLFISSVAARIAEIALRSMLFEVSVTPKPGLVDRFGSGAHSDMDFFTFMASSASLTFGLQQCAQAGYEFRGELSDLLADLRDFGKTAEIRMLQVTQGVNTQKGLIFILGLLCGVAGYVFRQGKELKPQIISEHLAILTKGIVEREYRNLSQKESLTAGEAAFLHYGIRGVRGEVEDGLPTVIAHGLPAIREALKKGKKVNEAGLHALMRIMAVAHDTTILNRHDIQTLRRVQKQAQEVLENGSIFTEKGKKMIERLEKEFTAANISTGGVADLLAATFTLHFWETEKMFY